MLALFAPLCLIPGLLASPVVGDEPLRVGLSAPAIGLEQLQTPELQGAPGAGELDWGDLKGRVVVLEFWATWCGPCIREMPFLNTLVDEFKDKPVCFISITKEDQKTVEAFLRDTDLKTWIGLDTDGSMHKAYAVRGIPRTILVDQDGIVLGIMSPHDLTAEVLNRVLAGNPPRLPDGTGERSLRAGEDPDAGAAATPPVFQLTLRPSQAPMGMLSQHEGKLTADGFNLPGLIELAYAGEEAEHTVLPADMDAGTYTLVASMPPGREHALEPSIRGLLRNAFGITAKAEDREIDVAVVTLPNGPGEGFRKYTGGRSEAMFGEGSFEATMQDGHSIIEWLSEDLGMPIDDRTGLGDRLFNFKVEWDPKVPGAKREAMLRATGAHFTTEKRRMRVLVMELE